jgi:lipopolysaccharide export LptBFGC system permease protein LptF
VKKKLLAMLNQPPDPLVQQGKVAALQAQQAGTAKTQSETVLNQAKAQQANTGSATGVVERQMDAAAKVQDTQLKGQQAAQKIVAQRESGKLKFAQEMVKTQLGHASDLQKLAQNEQRHNQQMRHAEQKQQAALKATAKRPPGNGGGGLK